MKRFNIPFSPPDMTEAEVKEVAAAILSGWITTGPRTKELERRIATYIGTNKAVCLNSQTACAEIALRLLGIGAGDEVIVPVYTYTASASIVAHVGATIVFVDVQPNSLEMDYEAVEAAITPRTKAIIPVDLAGIPCDYEQLFAIVENKRPLFQPANEIQQALGRVAICADAAHAFGASRKGEMVGAIADFTAFSFHAVKNLTTAEGGALTWKNIPGISDDELYRKVQLFSLHGQSKDALAKTQLGAWEYDIVGPWYKCNMTDIAAAIGLVQMQRYPEMLMRRKQIIEQYDQALNAVGIQTLNHYCDNHHSSGHLYITRVPNITTEQRQTIIEQMALRGIATNVHYKPLPMMTAYRNMGFDIANFPNAYAQFANEITLPLHTQLTDEQVQYIIENYIEIVKTVQNA